MCWEQTLLVILFCIATAEPLTPDSSYITPSLTTSPHQASTETMEIMVESLIPTPTTAHKEMVTSSQLQTVSSFMATTSVSGKEASSASHFSDAATTTLSSLDLQPSSSSDQATSGVLLYQTRTASKMASQTMISSLMQSSPVSGSYIRGILHQHEAC